jgi:hypothetical protein
MKSLLPFRLQPFFRRLTNQRLPERIFRDLVVCRREGLIVGEKVAIDSIEIDAYEKAGPKSKTIRDGQHLLGVPIWTATEIKSPGLVTN